MGNTQSKLLIIPAGSSALYKSMYYIVLSVSAYITLVCLFDIPRSHVSLQVHQVVQAAAVPTITASGSPVTNMGTTGSIGDLYHAKLDSSQSVVLMSDNLNGALLASAAPYAFDKRTTGSGASMCSFDNNEVSSPGTSNIYCRRGSSATFLAFKYSDLSAVQDGSGNNPLYAASGTTVGSGGMITVVGSFMFATSDKPDSTLYRVDLSTLTYTGTVASTKTVQDTSATTEQHRYGVCDSGNFCYTFSGNHRLAKYTQDTAGSPTYVDTLDLSGTDQLDSPLLSCANCGNIALDKFGNNLLVATTFSFSNSFKIAKIDLGTFVFVSRVILTDSESMHLCDSCLTASSGDDETFMMVISSNSAKDARFIKLSDMTEVTNAGSFVNTANKGLAGWLTASQHGGIVTDNDEVHRLTTTGVGPSTTSTTTATTTTSTDTSTTSSTTTSTDTSTTSSTTSTTETTTVPPVLGPGNNNQQQQEQSEPTSQGVIVMATTGSILGVATIVGIVIWFASSSSSSSAAAGAAAGPPGGEKTTYSNTDNGEELQEVK